MSSTSLKKNIRTLEEEAKSLYKLASLSKIEFDLDKTELIHFTKLKEAQLINLTLPNGIIVKPKDLVRWLGIWFDHGLTFKQHLAIRIQQAENNFYQMARLANKTWDYLHTLYGSSILLASIVSATMGVQCGEEIKYHLKLTSKNCKTPLQGIY